MYSVLKQCKEDVSDFRKFIHLNWKSASTQNILMLFRILKLIYVMYNSCSIHILFAFATNFISLSAQIFSSCEDFLLLYTLFFSVFEKMLLKTPAVLPRVSKQYQKEIINTNILYVIF